MALKLPKRKTASKAGAAAFVLLLSLILLIARTGFIPNGGTTPKAQELCGQAVSWKEVWKSPESFRGSTVAVTGTVASAAFLPGVNGQPTFLNLGKAHPKTPRFEIVIWGEHRDDFLSAVPFPPEQYYKQRQLCAAGTVSLHEGVPQIEVRDPEQILLHFDADN